MLWTPLTSSDATAFNERFLYFGDATVRRLVLTWIPDACTIYVDAMDSSDNNKWVQVQLHCVDVLAFSWNSEWSGSVQCEELFVTFVDDAIYVAVALEHDKFQVASDFTDDKVDMMIKSRSVSFAIAEISD